MSNEKRSGCGERNAENGEYRPPPPSAREPDVVMPVDLPGYPEFPYLQMMVRQMIYRNMIVGFSIELLWRQDLDRSWNRVCRLDSSHGTVHMHLYNQKSKREERTEIARIPADTGWNFVNAKYYEVYDYLLENVEEIISRWRQ